MKKFSVFLCVVALLCVASAAHANLFNNGSFELGPATSTSVTGSIPVGSTVINDWTVITNPIDRYADGEFGLTAQDGNWFLDLTDAERYAGPGGVGQTIYTTVGNRYNLSFWLGSDEGYNSNGAPSITVGGGGSAFSDMTFTGSASGVDVWEQFGFDFIANAASYTITFQGSVPNWPANYYIGLDNVSATLVPEPASMLLLGCGLLGLAAIGRKKFFKK